MPFPQYNQGTQQPGKSSPILEMFSEWQSNQDPWQQFIDYYIAQQEPATKPGTEATTGTPGVEAPTIPPPPPGVGGTGGPGDHSQSQRRPQNPGNAPMGGQAAGLGGLGGNLGNVTGTPQQQLRGPGFRR